MRGLYLASVWLHILAASIWIGGMAFLVLVVVPWLRKNPGVDAGALLGDTGKRFSRIGWSCFGVLVATGTFNLWVRGVRFASFIDPDWLGSPFGKAVVTKLSVFGSVLLLSAFHDFSLGPRAVLAVKRDARSPEALRARRAASHLGRLSALLALVLVALGVVLVRGAPF